jgi:hypothetical protein
LKKSSKTPYQPAKSAKSASKIRTFLQFKPNLNQFSGGDNRVEIIGIFSGCEQPG